MPNEEIGRKELASLIREWRETKEARLTLERDAAVIRKEEQELHSKVIEGLRACGAETEGMVVDDRVTGISQGVSLRISDWRALKAFLIEKDLFDLLTFKVSKSAVKEYGEEVPGIESVLTYSTYDRKA